MRKDDENLESMQFNEAAAIYHRSPDTAIRLSRMGVEPEFVVDLMDAYRFSKQEASYLANISTKTLDRHLQSGKSFKGLQSDRFLELAELMHQGVNTFGSKEKFVQWLNSKIPALNNAMPREWLDTHKGIELIEDELGRIRHGIFA